MRKKILGVFVILIIIFANIGNHIYARTEEIKNDKLWVYFIYTDYINQILRDSASDDKKDEVDDADDDDDDDADYSFLKNEIEKNEQPEVNNWENGFDIIGFVNDKWRRTTWANGGYHTILKVNNKEPKELTFNNTISDSIENDIECSFVNDGNFVKVEYILKNTSNENLTISLGTYADVQIGNNDQATIERMNNDMGVKLYDEEDDIQFQFYGKNVGNVTDIDKLWVGTFPDQETHYFNQNSINKLVEEDSAFSFSWTDRVIKPGETQKYSVLLGTGKLTSIPVIELDNKEKEPFNADDIMINGIVSDQDEDTKVTIHYRVDGGQEETSPEYILENKKYNFTIDLSNKNLTLGDHSIEIWAIDNQGNISNFVNKDFFVNNAKAPTLNMSEEWTKDPVKFTVSDTEENKSKVSKYQYKIDNGSWEDINLGEEKTALSKTGTATVYIRSIGLDMEESPTVSKKANVDKESPICSCYVEDKKVHINAEDKHSGVDYIEYVISDEKNIKSGDEFKKYSKEFEITSLSNNTMYLHVRVHDKVGNTSETTKELVMPKPATIECSEKFKDKDVKFKIVDSENQDKDGYKYYVRINNGEWATANQKQYYEIMNSVEGTNTIETRTMDSLGRFSSINKKTYTFEKSKEEKAAETANEKGSNGGSSSGGQASSTGTQTEAESKQSYFIKATDDNTIAKTVIPKTGSVSIKIIMTIVVLASIIKFIKYYKIKRDFSGK